jgi:hypothetical protein
LFAVAIEDPGKRDDAGKIGYAGHHAGSYCFCPLIWFVLSSSDDAGIGLVFGIVGVVFWRRQRGKWLPAIKAVGDETSSSGNGEKTHHDLTSRFRHVSASLVKRLGAG